MNPGPQKQFDRHVVLEKAMQIFWAHGYEATGMTQLVEELGIGRQSLYNSFGDKRGLFIEAIRFYQDSFVSQMFAMLEREGSPLQNLRDLFNYWTTECADSECQGCLLGNTCAEFGDKDPEITEFLKKSLDASENAFFNVLERAKEAGELPANFSSRDVARLIVNTGQGLSVVSKVKHDKEFATSVVHAIEMLVNSHALDRVKP